LFISKRSALYGIRSAPVLLNLWLTGIMLHTAAARLAAQYHHGTQAGCKGLAK
jgi:hypothetical protein